MGSFQVSVEANKHWNQGLLWQASPHSWITVFALSQQSPWTCPLIDCAESFTLYALSQAWGLNHYQSHTFPPCPALQEAYDRSLHSSVHTTVHATCRDHFGDFVTAVTKCIFVVLTSYHQLRWVCSAIFFGLSGESGCSWGKGRQLSSWCNRKCLWPVISYLVEAVRHAPRQEGGRREWARREGEGAKKKEKEARAITSSTGAGGWAYRQF